MERNETKLYPRRTLVLYGVLFFLVGAGVGGVTGIYGLRYLLFRRPPPPPGKMTSMVMERIENDFTIAPESRKNIEQELDSLHKEIADTIRGSRSHVESLVAAGAERIARHFPDDASRDKWRKDYHRYFPRLPKPPPHRDKR